MALSVAIIGLGKMGLRHGECCRKRDDARLCWGVTRSPATAERAEEALGVPCGTDLEAALARQLPGLAIIAAPTAEHCALSELLLSKGVGVLVEKPLAATFPQAEALQEARGFLQVAHCLAYDSAVIAARAAVAADAIGEVANWTLRRRGPAVMNPGAPGDRQEPAWVYEQLIHLTSVIHTLTGEPIVAVNALHARDLRRHGERLRGDVALANGAEGMVDIAPEGDEQRLEIALEGTKGRLEVTVGRNPTATVHRNGVHPLPIRRGNLFELQLADVLRRVEGHLPPLEDARRGLWAMEASRLLLGEWASP